MNRIYNLEQLGLDVGAGSGLEIDECDIQSSLERKSLGAEDTGLERIGFLRRQNLLCLGVFEQIVIALRNVRCQGKFFDQRAGLAQANGVDFSPLGDP
jgi:hypothetical protein